MRLMNSSLFSGTAGTAGTVGTVGTRMAQFETKLALNLMNSSLPSGTTGTTGTVGARVRLFSIQLTLRVAHYPH